MIETARCVLDEFGLEDREHVIRLYTDTDVRRFLGGPVDVAAARTNFERWASPGPGDNRWAIRTKDRRTFVGAVSLSPHHDGDETEVSYLLLPEWWGKGYGGETVQAVINFAFCECGLSQIIAETQTDNIASCKMLERIGLRRVKTVVRFGAQQSIYSVTKQTEQPGK